MYKSRLYAPYIRIYIQTHLRIAVSTTKLEYMKMNVRFAVFNDLIGLQYMHMCVQHMTQTRLHIQLHKCSHICTDSHTHNSIGSEIQKSASQP